MKGPYIVQIFDRLPTNPVLDVEGQLIYVREDQGFYIFKADEINNWVRVGSNSDVDDENNISGEIDNPEIKSYIVDLSLNKDLLIRSISASISSGFLSFILLVNGSPVLPYSFSLSPINSDQVKNQSLQLNTGDKIELLITSSISVNQLTYTIDTLSL
jgi:hypothetical protein